LLKRLLSSISAIFAGQLLNIVGNLLLVPLFLSRWSTGTYGEWMALSALVGYFGVTDLGMFSYLNAMTAAPAAPAARPSGLGDGLLCGYGPQRFCSAS
jgi:hypothetical protein